MKRGGKEVLGVIWSIAAAASVVWIIWDVITVNKRLSDTAKVLWVLAAVVFNFVAAIVYYLVEKR